MTVLPGTQPARKLGLEETFGGLYLERCQVDTPAAIVRAVWNHVRDLRQGRELKVVDFGAGDGRFSHDGDYASYVGYEVDRSRYADVKLPPRARLVHACAFDHPITDADLCIGNPPFVRNQDLPNGWAREVAGKLCDRTGVLLSGLANAWQYFFLLALASVKDDGLCALILPYEWVGRPSSARLRNYIEVNRWNVSVYRLAETTFAGVLTTSSITIVDKSSRNGLWRYYEEARSGEFRRLISVTGGRAGMLPYGRRPDPTSATPRAIRGLSPGTQAVLTLREADRARFDLKIGTDVVPCITSLRSVDEECENLDAATFNELYRDAGARCWLPRTDRPVGPRLLHYLKSIDPSRYQTKTCLEREVWWKFNMPPVPIMLLSQGFTGRTPKVVHNEYQVRAVGGVCGIYGLDEEAARRVRTRLRAENVGRRVVRHSNGLMKIEIGQLNALLPQLAVED